MPGYEMMNITVFDQDSINEHVTTDWTNGTKYSQTISAETRVLVTIVLCIVIVVGVPGNIILIVSVLRQKTLRSSLTFIILVSLAVTDCFLICTAPYGIIRLYIIQERTVTHLACKIVLFVMFSSVGASVNHLVIFSVFRFLLLTCPLWAQRHANPKNICLVCLVVWLWVLFSAVSVFFTAGLYSFNTTDDKSYTYCMIHPTQKYVVLGNLVGGTYIPLLLLTGFHVAKLMKLRKNTMAAKNQSTVLRRTVSSKAVLAIVLSFATCWQPLTSFNLVIYVFGIPLSYETFTYLPLLESLIFFNSAFDPILYFFMSKCMSICRNKSV